MKIAGVYKITNTITGDFYIGSSKDINHRWADHKCPYIWKRHLNSKLYKDMAQYGKDKFIFEVLEETDNLREREQYYIEQLKPTYNSMYAKGHDIERWKETSKRYKKEWYKVNRNEHLTKHKEWRKIHRDEQLTKSKVYYSRLCLYNSETLTLGALIARFSRQGKPQPTLEAKKYLITGRD